MAIRTTTGDSYRLYDASADLAHTEEELLKILFICGFSESVLETITIDEVMESLTEIFCYDQREVVESFKDPNDPTAPLTDFGDGSLYHWPKPVVPWPKPASRDLISKRLFTLKTIARRMWRWRALASGMVSS